MNALHGGDPCRRVRAARRGGAVLLALALAPAGLPVLAPRSAAAAPEATAQDFAPHTQRLLLELAERERDLERRESEVAARERALAELESEMVRRLEEWDALRIALEQRIDELKQGLGDRVALLAKTYGAMRPADAAELIAKLDRDLATAVVSRMKSKQAAKVLAELPRDLASRLSKRMVTPLVLEDVEPEESR